MAQTTDSAVQPAAWYSALPRAGYAALKRIAVQGDWFEVYQVQEGIYALYESGHFQEVISYLLVGADKALLVDTGLGMGNIRKVAEQLTNLPIAVVNTHSHFDHIGDNWRFEQVYILNHPTAVKRLAAGAAHAELAGEVEPGANARPYPAGFDPAAYTIPPCTFETVEEGHVFDLGNRRLRVIYTPGHSDDSIMLADDGNRLLFTGDTFYPASLYVFFASPDPVDQLLDTYRRTMERLAGEFSGYTLLCSHNEPLCSGGMLAQAAQAFAAIQAGRAPDEVGNTGMKKYQFDGFAIITR